MGLWRGIATGASLSRNDAKIKGDALIWVYGWSKRALGACPQHYEVEGGFVSCTFGCNFFLFLGRE